MEKNLTEKESLELITDMINQAKRNYRKGGSFYFLVWGWVIMIANLMHYFLNVYTDFKYPYLVWLITIPTAILTTVYSVRRSGNARVVGHLDRLYGHLWLAISVGIVISLLFMKNLAYNHSAVIIMLAGLGTYISGNLMKFRPLIYGGVLLIVASVLAFNVSIPNQNLVAGIGIFAGYIIPGYLLQNQEK